MKRLWFAVFLILAACGPSGPEDATSQEAKSDQIVAARQNAQIAECPESKRTEPVTELPDITLSCLGSAQELSLARLEGPWVINLWASWCAPCREELPHFARLATDENIRVLGVVYEDPALGKAIELARISKVRYPSAVDPNAALREPLGVVGLPQTIFVSADGTVEIKRRVYQSYESLASDAAEFLGAAR